MHGGGEGLVSRLRGLHVFSYNLSRVRPVVVASLWLLSMRSALRGACVGEKRSTI